MNDAPALQSTMHVHKEEFLLWKPSSLDSRQPRTKVKRKTFLVYSNVNRQQLRSGVFFQTRKI